MSKKFVEHSGLNLTAVNQEVLAEWEKYDVFHKSVDEREGCADGYCIHVHHAPIFFQLPSLPFIHMFFMSAV